ncbi:hypothetical protein DL98DRAFT_55016 [Cadophora sp. DSE1049]|nr:hypothetical protein DL98DRAFT_55016 [Cadophora sp. DSE1049]
MHFSVTRNIDRRQIEVQGESRKTGARMINIQQANHAEIRGMHSDTTQLLTAARQENRELGNRLRDLYVADQNDIVAFVAQNNERFDQVHDSLGLMELDLEGIKLKGDETLLVVKQLANVINARGEGSAAIYIRVPRALYDPALSVWNGVSSRSSVMCLRDNWLIESVPHLR